MLVILLVGVKAQNEVKAIDSRLRLIVLRIGSRSRLTSHLYPHSHYRYSALRNVNSILTPIPVLLAVILYLFISQDVPAMSFHTTQVLTNQNATSLLFAEQQHLLVSKVARPSF
jgi:hypothetical protein